MSDKKEEVLKRFEAGESISKISKTLRINKSLIRSYLREKEKVEKEGRTEAVVYEDAVSGEEALQILDLYDFMAGAYLKEGLATGVLESKDCSAGPFTKESRLSGKALVYLASRARGDGVSFRKLFETLSRLSPVEGMREKIKGLEEERARLGEQASRVAEELCSAKKSLQEARDYIKVLEKRPGDKEKIRVLEEALERAKTALSDEQAKAMSLAASLQAIRQILDKGTVPALYAKAPEPAPAEPVKKAVPAKSTDGADKKEAAELISIKDWGRLNDVPYSTATDAARAGRITGIVVKGSRYFCPADADMVPTDSVCGKIRLKADLPDGYVSITGWAALHGMTGARARRLVQEKRIPGIVRIGSQTYAHRGINPLNPDGAVPVGGSMLPLKTVCRSQGVDYYAVRRKIAKAGVPDGAQKEGRNLFVPEATDLKAFLGKEGASAPKSQAQTPSTEGLVPFKPLTVAAGIPYMTAVHDLKRAGVKVTKIGRIAFVPEGTDLLELRKLYGRRLKEHPAEEIAAPAAEPSAEAVPAVLAEPVKEVQDKAGEDAVFNAAVATAAIKNVPVSDVCSTVFKVMIDEYGYRLGDAPTFDAVRAENGERDFMAVLKNFDRHYQRLNAG